MNNLVGKKTDDNVETLMGGGNTGLTPEDLAIAFIPPVVAIAVTVLLLVGTSKNQRYYLLPWMVVTAIGIIATPIYLTSATMVLSTLGANVEIAILLGIYIPSLGRTYNRRNKINKIIILFCFYSFDMLILQRYRYISG